MIDPPPLVHALLNAIGDPSLLIERERTVAANQAARRLFGEAIVGRDIRLAIRQPHALSAIQAGTASEIEVSGIGGVERSWGLLVRPVGDGLLLVRLSDRSAQRAAEKTRVDFVANASHELRTPLATIIGYAETLADDGELPEPLRRKFADLIHGEARRMLRIVSDLMSLSRIETERYRAPSDDVDLRDIALTAAANAGPLATERGARIEVDFGDKRPTVAGDHAQLLQLADNLVANALRYGCPTPGRSVDIQVEQRGREAVLQVRDHGDGIASEHIPRLTERFYRVDAARSRDNGGTGLGLAIVKHIVERHRGRLEISSTPGQGTTVSVTLPLAEGGVTKASPNRHA